MAPEARGTASLPSIQVLRAVAALGVMAAHLGSEGANRLGAANPLPNMWIGTAGVDLFFVISGFIMLYASEGMFARPGAPVAFFTRRLIRIVPLYWAATAATIAIFLLLRATQDLTAGTIASSLLFIPYARPDGLLLPVHRLGWTLNYEMMFYAIFAVALILPRGWCVLAVTATLATMVLIGLATALPQPLAFWCDPIVLEFCLGMAIALAFRHGWRLPRVAAVALIALGLLSMGVLSLTMPTLPRLVMWGLPAAAVIAGAALVAPAPAARRWRLLVTLGDASYSIYLVHALVILTLPVVVHKLAIDVSLWPWTYVAVVALAMLGASLAVYVLFERPVTRALQRRFLSRPRKSDAEPAATSVASRSRASA